MICLRTYQCVARSLHWCDRCCQQILPGEMYEGFVQILPNQEHRLIVWKTHIYPSCDLPDDPEEEVYRRDEASSRLSFAKYVYPQVRMILLRKELRRTGHPRLRGLGGQVILSNPQLKMDRPTKLQRRWAIFRCVRSELLSCRYIAEAWRSPLYSGYAD